MEYKGQNYMLFMGYVTQSPDVYFNIPSPTQLAMLGTGSHIILYFFSSEAKSNTGTFCRETALRQRVKHSATLAQNPSGLKFPFSSGCLKK